MEMYLKHILPNFILMSSMIYSWHKLLDKKIDFKNIRLYISLILIMIVSIFNYIIIEKFIRIILITMILMFFIRFLFKENIKKCIITPIYYQLISLISESLCAIILSLTLGASFEPILNNFYGLLFINLFIGTLSIIISTRKNVIVLYNNMLKTIDKIKQKHLFTLCFLLLVILNIADMAIYYKIKFEYLLLFNVLVIFVCFIIFLYSLITKNKYNKVYNKYNVAVNGLKEYENMMTKYRIANHENKNLLLTIRAMIINNEKDIPKYIDSIVEEKYIDDEQLLFKMSVIPSGGLRATIYSEILKIKDKKINYSLNIDKKLSTIDLIELDENTIVDICKIVSVFIDNAIEEVLKLKNKNIQIHLFIDKKTINIKVSNNYREKIEVDKIYEKGYTTKGENRGYGLALVKNIIDRNDMLENRIEITNKLFHQLLLIKYDKQKKYHLK